TVEYLLRRERRLWARERRMVAEAVFGMLRAEIRNDALLRRSLGERYLSLDASARNTLHYEIWRLGHGIATRAGAKPKGPAGEAEGGPSPSFAASTAELLRRGLAPALLPGVRACLEPEIAEQLLPTDPVERLAVR